MHPRRLALVWLTLAFNAACSGARCPSPEPPKVNRSSLDADEDGVRQLLPSASGASFRLGARDPNQTQGLEIEQHTQATLGREGKLQYWSIKAHDLEYASGGSGKTIRLHIFAGGEQRFTWKTQHGYLGTPRDFRNQELTAYVRVHGIFDLRRAAVSLKIRGGAHTTRDGDLASCTMLTFAPRGARAVTRFGKELHHPDYDYVPLEPRFSASLEEGRWVGLKLVSYFVPGAPASVMNRLYVDTAPFDGEGRPRNDWRLFSEYLDVEGKSTGRYDKLADWGGVQATVRSDGLAQLDVAILSAREIQPPAHN
jgi:hypothetical protein